MHIFHANEQSGLSLIRDGAVFAYPTEGVWGFGCLPEHTQAVMRLRKLKSRANEKGFILIASNWSQVSKYISDSMHFFPIWQKYENEFVTCVYPASAMCPRDLCADDNSIAIRISTHPTVVALCDALESALVSTSANFSGAQPANDITSIQQQFLGKMDAIVAGELGGATKPSRLIDLRKTPPKVLRN